MKWNDNHLTTVVDVDTLLNGLFIEFSAIDGEVVGGEGWKVREMPVASSSPKLSTKLLMLPVDEG